ncbi:MAG: carbohydrate-binding family 9-like protein [Nitrospirota bacterium]|nr:carbohydrate-binding family 9-like protein [Nitrospirota bacterium]
MPQYIVRSAVIKPELAGHWDGAAWDQADTLELIHFRLEGSDHRPKTSVRLLYDSSGIFGIFKVEDQYVRSVHRVYQSPVCKDSCVEFFVQPKADKGYFNFEFNCGGALFCSYIIDPVRTPEGFRDFVKPPEEDGKQVLIYHSMPKIVEPEITEPATWFLEFFIPFSLLEKYVGTIGNISRQTWQANFYKCGDETSHPHWASWTELPEKSFHLPACFGKIIFE